MFMIFSQICSQLTNSQTMQIVFGQFSAVEFVPLQQGPVFLIIICLIGLHCSHYNRKKIVAEPQKFDMCFILVNNETLPNAETLQMNMNAEKTLENAMPHQFWAYFQPNSLVSKDLRHKSPKTVLGKLKSIQSEPY